MRIQRLLGLLCILANADKITVQELADRLEVSKRTIFRDLDMLNCAGIPIVSYPGIGGGVSIVEGYKVDKKVLSTNDTEKIFTALNALKSIDGDTSITNLIAKLVPEEETDIFSQSRYVINLSSWFSDSITHEKAITLHHAICERSCVRLEYISKSSRLIRIVEPHKLTFKQSHWYIYAFCQKRKDFRLFKLNRIVSLEILKEKFQLRPINNIEFKNDYGASLFSSQNKEGFFEVVLEYDVSKEFELTNNVDASFFEKNIDPQLNYSKIRFYTSDLSRTADFIMEIVDKVRVVSPPELYSEIKRRLDKINTYYER